MWRSVIVRPTLIFPPRSRLLTIVQPDLASMRTRSHWVVRRRSPVTRALWYRRRSTIRRPWNRLSRRRARVWALRREHHGKRWGHARIARLRRRRLGWWRHRRLMTLRRTKRRRRCQPVIWRHVGRRSMGSMGGMRRMGGVRGMGVRRRYVVRILALDASYGRPHSVC